MGNKPLTSRQASFVNHYLSGQSAAEAARKAGYRVAYADKAAKSILKHPSVAAAIHEAQQQLRGKTMFDVEQAVVECDTMIAFAQSKNNAMAAAKLLELKCKLHGLLVEKLEVVPLIDLTAILTEARARAAAARVLPAPVLPASDEGNPYG